MVEHHICVDILIFNKQGALALQLRSKDDKSFPAHWDFSAGGHVEAGEDSQKAAAREVMEELNASGNLIFVSQEHFNYPAWNPLVYREIDATVYAMANGGPFNPDPKEVEMVEFFSFEKIQEMINEGTPFHPEFIMAWKKGLITKAWGMVVS